MRTAASGLAGGGRDHIPNGVIGRLAKENKCSTEPDLRQDFSKPPHGRNRCGADRAPPWRRQAADIGRGGRRLPLPVRKTGSFVSWSREVFRGCREFLRECRKFLRRSQRLAPRSIVCGPGPRLKTAWSCLSLDPRIGAKGNPPEESLLSPARLLWAGVSCPLRAIVRLEITERAPAGWGVQPERLETHQGRAKHRDRRAGSNCEAVAWVASIVTAQLLTPVIPDFPMAARVRSGPRAPIPDMPERSQSGRFQPCEGFGRRPFAGARGLTRGRRPKAS